MPADFETFLSTFLYLRLFQNMASNRNGSIVRNLAYINKQIEAN